MSVEPTPRKFRLLTQAITDTDALVALADEWHDLWQADTNATPFQSPAWLLPWWKHVGEGDLLIITVRNGDRQLVVLAPLYIYTQANGARTVFPLGVATSDYLDFLVRPGYEQDAVTMLMIDLTGRRKKYDICEWPQLRPDSHALRAPLPRFLSEHIGQNDEPNPVLPLPITLAELETTLSTHCKRKLRYYWKRSERLGAMTVEQATPETWEKHLDALFRLHEMRWQQKGEGGVLPPNVQAAHRESVPALLEIGACALYSVLLNGEIVGVFYGLQDPALPRPNRTWGRRLYCYIGGWNPNYAEIAPASVLIGHALEQAVKNGLTHCDFLRGAEPYKYVWGATDTHTMTRVLRKVQM